MSNEFGIFLDGAYDEVKSLPHSYSDINNLLEDSVPEPEKSPHIFKRIDYCAPKGESITLKRAILGNTTQEAIDSFLENHTQELQDHYRGLVAYDLVLRKQDETQFLFTAPRIEQYVLFKIVYTLGDLYASKKCSKQTFDSWKTILLDRKVSETTINRAVDCGQRDHDSFNAYA